MLVPQYKVSVDALQRSLEKVAENNGSPGIDGVTVAEFTSSADRYLAQLQLTSVWIIFPAAQSWERLPLRSIRS
jgi:hypothetical protein